MPSLVEDELVAFGFGNGLDGRIYLFVDRFEEFGTLGLNVADHALLELTDFLLAGFQLGSLLLLLLGRKVSFLDVFLEGSYIGLEGLDHSLTFLLELLLKTFKVRLFSGRKDREFIRTLLKTLFRGPRLVGLVGLWDYFLAVGGWQLAVGGCQT